MKISSGVIAGSALGTLVLLAGACASSKPAQGDAPQAPTAVASAPAPVAPTPSASTAPDTQPAPSTEAAAPAGSTLPAAGGAPAMEPAPETPKHASKLIMATIHGKS